MGIPAFALERYFARWEFVAPYLLCSSDLETMGMGELLAMADVETRSLWENLTLGYTEYAGHPLLRAEIARLYSSVTLDDVYTFAGAEEAIYVFMRAVLNAGDHLIAFAPGYQSLYEVARSAGADVTVIPLTMQNGWRVDPEAVRLAVTPATRLIMVNAPHNPTGTLPDAATFGAITRVARDAGAYLFCDEVYRFSEYAPESRLPTAADVYERGVSLGVLSKSFGLAGLRTGWLATRDRHALHRVAAYKDYTTICNNAPGEILSIIALRSRERIVERNLSIVRANLVLLDAFFERHAGTFDWVRPQAGGIGFPRLRRDAPIDEFVKELVHEQGVLLLPGSVYDDAPSAFAAGNHFRIGFGRSNFPEALARLERFL
ncbi:MAG: aminotransferase class I/II-fold pyridoxal phosphate-dependent enzyme [Fibrella sp.]|nr:aminotransferase class I/II-fold pyridoxal phosphate-dependent enzyme [Armatimonadota bacterium]